MDEDVSISQWARWIESSERIAVLSGAGISVPSGIPDFRSDQGIYQNAENRNVFDVEAFLENPAPYYAFARWFYPKVRAAAPNAAHRALAEWERCGHDVCIATQNVDDLHQRAGSSRVYPVHGSMLTSVCRRCGNRMETVKLDAAIRQGEIPRCNCGGVLKPEITFFGEALPQDAWMESARAMQQADLVLVVGSSLTVYPAASLPEYRPPDSRLVIINRDETPLDCEADLVFHGDMIPVFDALQKLLTTRCRT